MAVTRRRIITEPAESVFGIKTPTKEAFIELARATSQTFCDVLITPAVATILLSLNTDNRPLRDRRVAMFKEILAEKRWINTGEPIIVSDKGPLNEGQHRLTGIVESGISAIMDVRFGISRKAFMVTGTGAHRTSADVLHLMNIRYPTQSAAVAKLAMSYANGLPEAFRWYVGTDQVARAMQRWPDIEEAVALHRSLITSVYFRNAPSMCFTWLALRSAGVETTSEFLTNLANGFNRKTRDSISILHDRMVNETELRLGHSDMMVEKLALFIIAWTAWIERRRVSAVRWQRSEPYPVMPGVTL